MILNFIAAGLTIYVATWVFLKMREQCRRRYRLNTPERSSCTIVAGAFALAFAAVVIGAMFL